MLGEIIGLGLIGGALLSGRGSFYDHYDAKRVREIRARASDPRLAKADVLLLLHDYTRNVGPARVGDVASILGNYSWHVVSKLIDEDLVRVSPNGWLQPGKQLATHGSFVMMHTGGQG